MEPRVSADSKDAAEEAPSAATPKYSTPQDPEAPVLMSEQITHPSSATNASTKETADSAVEDLPVDASGREFISLRALRSNRLSKAGMVLLVNKVGVACIGNKMGVVCIMSNKMGIMCNKILHECRQKWV